MPVQYVVKTVYTINMKSRPANLFCAFLSGNHQFFQKINVSNQQNTYRLFKNNLNNMLPNNLQSKYIIR
jgi:hypothetical protein